MAGGRTKLLCVDRAEVPESVCNGEAIGYSGEAEWWFGSDFTVQSRWCCARAVVRRPGVVTVCLLLVLSLFARTVSG